MGLPAPGHKVLVHLPGTDFMRALPVMMRISELAKPPLHQKKHFQTMAAWSAHDGLRGSVHRRWRADHH
jgi:hypothetical protein